jgi:hypothetical protein
MLSQDTKNSTFATLAAPAAMPLNPSSPAINMFLTWSSRTAGGFKPFWLNAIAFEQRHLRLPVSWPEDGDRNPGMNYFGLPYAKLGQAELAAYPLKPLDSTRHKPE